MKTAVKIALAVLMGCGALLLVLGIVIWTGNGDQLIPVHIGFGIVLVLSLWTIAAIGARAGVASGTVALAVAWGLLVVVLGLAQEELLPGSWHWTIQVLHLAISMGAIWWGRRLLRLIAIAERPVDSPRLVPGPRVTTSGTGST
jgi:H+/gluconate symporter-like permease